MSIANVLIANFTIVNEDSVDAIDVSINFIFFDSSSNSFYSASVNKNTFLAAQGLKKRSSNDADVKEYNELFWKQEAIDLIKENRCLKRRAAYNNGKKKKQQYWSRLMNTILAGCDALSSKFDLTGNPIVVCGDGKWNPKRGFRYDTSVFLLFTNTLWIFYFIFSTHRVSS